MKITTAVTSVQTALASVNGVTGDNFLTVFKSMDSVCQQAVLQFGQLGTAEKDAAVSALTAAAAQTTYSLAQATTTVGLTAECKGHEEAIKAELAEVAATEALTAEKVKETVQRVLVAKGTDKEAASSVAGTVAKNLETGATITLTGALKTLWATMAANPMLVTVAAVTALIAALYALSEALALPTLDDRLTTLEDAQTELSEATSAVDELTSAIEENKERIEELQALRDAGTATIVDEEELDSLIAENDELERQLKIKQEIQRAEEKEANDAAVDALETNIESQYRYVKDEYGNDAYAASVSQTDELQNAMNHYKELEATQASLEEQQLALAESGDTTSSAYQAVTSELDSVNTEMEDTRTYAAELADQILTQADSLDSSTESGAEWLDIIDSLMDSYETFLDDIDGVSIADRLTDALDSGDLSDVTSTLSELYDNGELSAVAVRDLANEYASLASFMSNNKISASDFAAYYKALFDVADEAASIDYKSAVSGMGSAWSAGKANAVVEGAAAQRRREAARSGVSQGALDDQFVEAINQSWTDAIENVSWDPVEAKLADADIFQPALDNFSQQWADFIDYLPDEDLELVYQIGLEQDTSGWTIQQWGDALNELAASGDYVKDKIESAFEAFGAGEELTGSFSSLNETLAAMSDLYAEDLEGISFTDGLESFGEASLQKVAVQLEAIGYSCDGTVEGVAELVDMLTDRGVIRSVGKLADSIEELWDSDDFDDSRSDLEDLARTAGITAGDITDLASDNETLSNILNETGMSASYLANCFQLLANGRDILSILSADALRVNDALSVTSDILAGVDSNYSAYSDSLGDDYDAQFDNFQATYESLGEMFENGTYGKDFWRTIEYLFGEGHATDSIEDLYQQYKQLGSIFSEDDNGLGFLETLYKKQGDNDWVSYANGSYSFEVPTDDYQTVADIMGLTYDEVAACMEALGMFGDFSEYTADELVEAFSNLNMTMEDTEGNAVLSKQSIEDMLTSLGYETWQIEQIMADLEETSGLKVLDFDVTSLEEAEDLLSELSELGELDISGGNVDVSDLVNMLSTMGMSDSAIQSFMASLDELGIGWMDAEGNVIDYADAVDYASGVTADLATESLSELKDSAESVQDIANQLFGTEFTFNFDSTDADDLDEQLDQARQWLELCEVDGVIDINAEGYDEAAAVFAALYAQKLSLEDPVIMHVDTSAAKGDSGTFFELLQQYYDTYNNYQLALEIGADTTEYESSLESIESSLSEYDTYTATLGLDLEADTSTLYDQIDSITAEAAAELAGNEALIGLSYDATVTYAVDTSMVDAVVDAAANGDYDLAPSAYYDVDDSEVTSFIAANHDTTADTIYSATMSSSSYASFINKYKNITGTITYYTKTVGSGSQAQGTAHATGTAYDSGDWGTKDSGTALMGELGPELLVRNGKFYTVGDDSAELVQYQKGDIIFNAEQTRQILANGKITNGAKRGVAYVTGTAYPAGTVSTVNAATGKKYTSSTSSSKSSGSSSSGSSSGSSSSSSSNSSSSDDDVSEKDFDWIEVLLDRLERRIESLQTTAESAYKSFSVRNNALRQEMSAVSDEISAQEQAYETYMAFADQVDLSDKWKKKVQSGAFDISTVTDEDLADAIQEYQELYEKALDCQQAAQDLAEDLSGLYEDLFDNTATQFDGVIDRLEHQITMFENYIDLAEAQGYVVSAQYYKAMVKTKESEVTKLEKEQAALLSALNEALDSGAITLYSEAWYDMQSQIDEVTESIVEATTAIQEYKNELQTLNWDEFDTAESYISRLTNEASFFIGLFESDGLFNDNGSLTDAGLATMGLYVQNLETYKSQIADYGEEIAAIQEQIQNDPYNTTLIERLHELQDAQQEAIESAQAQQQALVDLVEEGFQYELDALQDVIDAYTDALDSAADLYEYQKKVAEQTEEIAQIEKQLSAYSGDDSEEAKKTVQELKVSLAEAQSDLEDTQYDQYIDSQKELLSNLYDEYESLLNQRLDDVSAIISDCTQLVTVTLSSISDSIVAKADDWGYTMSSEMESLWGSDGYFASSVSQLDEDLASSLSQLDEHLTSGTISLSTCLDLMNVPITDALNLLNDSTSDGLTSLDDSVSGGIDSLGDSVSNGLDSLGDSVSDGVSSLGTSITSGLGTLNSSITGGLQTVLGNIKTYVEKIYSAQDTTASSNVATTTASDKTSSTTATGTTSSSSSSKTTTSTTSSKTTTATTSSKTTTSTSSSSSSGSSSSSSSSTKSSSSSSGDGVPKVGEKVKYVSGKYYATSYGTGSSGSKNKGSNVYITKIVSSPKSGQNYPIHISTGKKLGSGDLGWLKKSQISGYASGVQNLANDLVAWINEEGPETIVRPSEDALLTSLKAGDSVLNAKATENIWSMANNPGAFIGSYTNGADDALTGGSSQNDVSVCFNLPGVSNYTEFMNTMRSDPKFETMIQAVTVDVLNGSSKMKKNNIKW